MAESRFERYEHHGRIVAVAKDLRGRDKEHCLCFSCKKFSPNPNPGDNCPIAQALFEFDCKYGLVTPVWECPEFEER